METYSVWTSLALLLGVVPVAIGTGVWFLRWVDNLNGISFKRDVLPVIHSNPIAASIYYGLRLVAVIGLFLAALFGKYI